MLEFYGITGQRRISDQRVRVRDQGRGWRFWRPNALILANQDQGA
jgi:hypothetical protein